MTAAAVAARAAATATVAAALPAARADHVPIAPTANHAKIRQRENNR